MSSRREGAHHVLMADLVFETRKPKPMLGKEVKIEIFLNKMFYLEAVSLKLLRGSNGEIKDK